MTATRGGCATLACASNEATHASSSEHISIVSPLSDGSTCPSPELATMMASGPSSARRRDVNCFWYVVNCNAISCALSGLPSPSASKVVPEGEFLVYFERSNEGKNSSRYKPSNPLSCTQRVSSGTSSSTLACECTKSGPKPYRHNGVAFALLLPPGVSPAASSRRASRGGNTLESAVAKSSVEQGGDLYLMQPQARERERASVSVSE
jgi:hypothetical protein